MTRMSRWLVVFTVLSALLALPLCGMATTPQVAGAELQVNTNTSSQVHNPVAAYDAAGRSIVVWENDLLGVRGRLYSASGQPVGAEMSLAANAAWSVLPGSGPVVFHHDPAVAFLPNGDFLVAWAQQKGTLEWTIFFENLQVQSEEIVVQRFNSSGSAVAQPFTVSSGGVGLKRRPQLAVRATGDVLATWMSSYGPTSTPAGEIGVFTRTLNQNGRPTGSQIEVDLGYGTGSIAATPAFAVAPDGSYVVAWESQLGTNPFNTSVLARAFSAAGAALGSPVAISGALVGPQLRPTVATDGQGSYLVAWQSYLNDVWHARIHGQIVGAAGNLLGKPVVISTGANGTAEVAPTAVAAPGNTFVLVWMEFDTWFPNGMVSVQVDNTGAPLGSEVWVNSQQINSQLRTALATNGAGHFLAPYEGFMNASQVGIRARFFDAQ